MSSEPPVSPTGPGTPTPNRPAPTTSPTPDPATGGVRSGLAARLRVPAVAAVVGGVVVALLSAPINTFFSWIPNPLAEDDDKPVEIELPKGDARLKIRDPVAQDLKISGVWTIGMDGEKQKFDLESAGVDITVQNNGENPALITEAKVTLSEVKHLDYCAHAGGDSPVSAAYMLKYPQDVRAPRVDKLTKIRFDVAPKRTDRLAISMGHDFEWDHLNGVWLFKVKVELWEASAKKYLPAKKTFLLASPPANAWELIDQLKDDVDKTTPELTPRCWERNAATVDTFLTAGGDASVSPSLKKLNEEFKKSGYTS